MDLGLGPRLPAGVAIVGLNELNDPDQGCRNHIHWSTLALTLPREGVLRRFPTEPARLKRFIDVRWSNGPVCNRCAAPEPSWIKTRAIFQCRQCKSQFSATTGTLLHRTRLSMGTWFSATESVILYRSLMPAHDIPAARLSVFLGIEYVAARRVRRLIVEDVRPEGRGFLSSAICSLAPKIPLHIEIDSDSHLRWLLDQHVSGKRSGG